MGHETQTRTIEAPLGQLERALIDEFVRARGYSPEALSSLPENEGLRLLADASIYASGRLAEVEARSHFLDEIHDGSPAIPRTGLD